MPIQLKILAVDDELATLDLFKAIVGNLGYEVVGLSDSREAAQRVMREKFDMVALDVQMPHLNGFELTRRVRQSSSNHSVPILMFTSSDDIVTMREGFAAGVTFFIGKPLSVPKVRGLFAAARGMMIEERRRYVRLPFAAEVICAVGERRYKVRGINLAQGGILLQGSCGLAPGEIAEVEFSIPGENQVLKIMGKVARKAGPQGMALVFIDPEPSDLAALKRYVIAQTPDQKAA
jgi:CheY-like chemotaxis protein